MSEVREGGCVCRAVRYRVRGQPERTSICHCTFCQRCTGSGFGVWVTFLKENVEISGGPLTIYEHRSDESGRWIRLEFCPRCGTTVACTFERGPEMRAMLGGTFDDPAWIKVQRHVWTRSARRWALIPPDVTRFEKHLVK